MSPTTSPATAQKLADEFSRIIRQWLTSDQLVDVVRRNRINAPGVCATHDFCDANIAMAEAFALVLTRESDPRSEADAELWNTAWRIARNTGFAPTNVADYFLQMLGARHGDDSLRDLPMKSPCGEDCVKAIDAAATHIAQMRAAFGDDCDFVKNDTIEIVRRVISVYWRG